MNSEQIFGQKESISRLESKDQDILKLTNFEGASSQSELARGQAMFLTGMLKEHQERENLMANPNVASNYVDRSEVAMTKYNMVCSQPSKKPIKDLGEIIGGLVEVFEPARKPKSSQKEEQVAGMIDKVGKQVMEDSGNKERRFMKASRRKNGGGSVGLVQARIETFLKISEDQVAKVGSTKKRKVASLEHKLKPNT